MTVRLQAVILVLAGIGWGHSAPVVTHYGRIAWYVIGDDDGNLTLHIAWLLGTALVFGALAIAGDWRDQRKPYGEDTRL